MRRARIVLVVAAALVLLGATPAAGAPGQRLMDRTVAWLETSVLRMPLEVPPLELAEPGELPPRTLGVAYPDRVLVIPRAALDLEAIRPRRLPPPFWEESVHLALHEALHYVCSGCPASPLEEGAVDAVALDLIPAWAARFVGRRPFVVQPGYPEEVAAIRRASARATGSRTWRTRAARIWRRALLLADEPGRQAMLAAVRP